MGVNKFKGIRFRINLKIVIILIILIDLIIKGWVLKLLLDYKGFTGIYNDIFLHSFILVNSLIISS